MTHQCHDVIGEVSSQVRSYKTREACEGDTCVVLVGTAEILEEKAAKVEIKATNTMKDRVREFLTFLIWFVVSMMTSVLSWKHCEAARYPILCQKRRRRN